MLQPYEQHRLHRIEQLTAMDDPRLARGLRDGVPCMPREYRYRILVVLATMVVAVIGVILVGTLWTPLLGAPSAILAASLVTVVMVATAPNR